MSDLGSDLLAREVTRRELLKYGLAGGAALASAGYAGRVADWASAAPLIDAATGTIITWSPDTRPDASGAYLDSGSLRGGFTLPPRQRESQVLP